MSMKKDDRKKEYVRIMKLMLESKHKEAFEALACMCGEDTSLFWLVDYESAVKELAEKSALKGAGQCAT